MCKNGKKLSSIMYDILYTFHVNNVYTSKWLSYISAFFDNTGFSFLWLLQGPSEMASVSLIIKKRLNDQYIQDWLSTVNNSPKCVFYRTYKHTFELEQYLCMLSPYLRTIVCRFRTANHKLPVETGRYNNVPRENRLCTFCNSNKFCDEFHLILECSVLKNIRRKFLPTYCLSNPNTINFQNVMSPHTDLLRKKLAQYIKQTFNCYNFHI